MPATLAIPPIRVSRAELESSVCRDSFFEFFKRFWEFVIHEPLVINWHIEYLCERVQRMAERMLARQPSEGDLLINIPPGTTKSTICSVMLPAWLWTRDPTIRMICASYAFRPTAEHLASLCYQIIMSDKYRELFPEVELAVERDSLLKTAQGGFRMTTSTGSFIQGMHSHLLVVDDPMSPEAAESDLERAKATQWLTGTLNSRRINIKTCPLLVVMQRLHEDDPAGHLLKTDKSIQHICLPAELDSNITPPELAARYVDGVLDARRLPLSTLQLQQTKLMDHNYAGQYQQRPVPRGGVMFRPDQISVEAHPPRLVMAVRYWDKAGTREKRGCWTVGCKMGVDASGRFWILDIVRGRWEAAAREATILQTALIDGKGLLIAVEQEPGSGGKESAQATVKRLAGFRCKMDRPLGDKILRADPYAMMVNAGNVSMINAAWNAEYLSEMRSFPHSTYKDQIDASSGAFAILTARKVAVGAL